MELTKELAEIIKENTNITGFCDIGVIDGMHIYGVLRDSGGKTGEPYYFHINKVGTPVFIKGIEASSRITRQIKWEQTTLLYADSSN